jgi:hypothetical protein
MDIQDRLTTGKHTIGKGITKGAYMRILTTIAAIGVLALAASGQEFTITNHGKLDTAALNLEATNVPIEECDSINYAAGRSMSWDVIDKSHISAGAAAGTDTLGKQAVNKTPGWISDLQKKEKAYQTERMNRAKRNEEKLSGYTPTEITIAKNMGLNPWQINRKQLKKWAQESDSAMSKM